MAMAGRAMSASGSPPRTRRAYSWWSFDVSAVQQVCHRGSAGVVCNQTFSGFARAAPPPPLARPHPTHLLLQQRPVPRLHAAHHPRHDRVAAVGDPEVGAAQRPPAQQRCDVRQRLAAIPAARVEGGKPGGGVVGGVRNTTHIVSPPASPLAPCAKTHRRKQTHHHTGKSKGSGGELATAGGRGGRSRPLPAAAAAAKSSAGASSSGSMRKARLPRDDCAPRWRLPDCCASSDDCSSSYGPVVLNSPLPVTSSSAVRHSADRTEVASFAIGAATEKQRAREKRGRGQCPPCCVLSRAMLRGCISR
jgi:hypothetical protein